MRQEIVDSLFDRPIFREGFKLALASQTIADNFAITVKHPPLLILDPDGGAKDVLLPKEADSKGLVYVIVNGADAAEAITVKDDADAVTVGTLAQGKIGLFVCDGVNWYGLVDTDTDT